MPVVSVPGADLESPLQGVPGVERPAEDPVGRGAGGSGGKTRFKIRDLLADKRCSQVVLDFLCTTDVGRLVPAEEDAGCEMSEQERRVRRVRRERDEGRRAEAEELVAGELPLGTVPAHTFLHGIRRRSRSSGFFLCLITRMRLSRLWRRTFFVPFPVCYPRGGGTLQAPLRPPPRPVPKGKYLHQGNYKGEGSERAWEPKERNKRNRSQPP